MSNAPWHTGTPPKNWDIHQTKLGAHFLQTRPWAIFQQEHGARVFYASGSHWSWVAVLESNRLGSRLYTPYGPTASSPASLGKAIDVLLACAVAASVDYVRIEPRAPNVKKILKTYRAKHAHRDIQPKHTFIKDLDRPDEQLLNEIASTNRRLYRHAKENGFTFRRSNDPKDIALFIDMIHQVAERTGIQPRSDAYFQSVAKVLFPLKAAALFVAEHKGEPVATCLAYEDTATRYYAHAANAESARKLQPSVPLMGYLIFDAKAKGKKHFDFYGVAPPYAEHHKWMGLSKFKRSFGGREVEYSGTWEIPLKKARYQAYRLFNRAQRLETTSKKIVRRSVRKVVRRRSRKSA